MLKGIKKVLIDIFNLFYKVIYGYARWVLAVVIVIICAQVFCRNILRTNIRWNQEVALLLTIWMAFLGIAVGAEKNLHIKRGEIRKQAKTLISSRFKDSGQTGYK